jgi:hypothetical protein
VFDPRLLTYAEKLQYEGYLRRQETNEAVRELSKKGTSIRQIMRQAGHSRKLARDVLRGQRLDVLRTRPRPRDIMTFRMKIKRKVRRETGPSSLSDRRSSSDQIRSEQA